MSEPASNAPLGAVGLPGTGAPHAAGAPVGLTGLNASVAGAATTGGWRWHLRALRASRRWAQTRMDLDPWLCSVPAPAPERLVWIGASAGWMIPNDWLARFRQVEVLDLDPLARPLFAFRHGRALDRSGVRWAWHRFDALENLDAVLGRWPDAVLFFDNLLGQQIYRCKDGEALEQWLEALHVGLTGRLWGSVHDYLSGPARAPGSAFAAPIEFELATEGGVRCSMGLMSGETRSGLAPDACRSHGVSVDWRAREAPARAHAQVHGVPIEHGSREAFDEALHQRAGGHGIWQDHRTAGVFPVGTRGVMIPWRFSRTHLHWLQAAWVDARGR